MGKEFIGDCPADDELGSYEMELAIKYIKQECGQPPRGVDVEVTWEGYEIGNEGEETQYPVISVVWDDSVSPYPDEYIGKCIEAFEHVELPEEIREQYRIFMEIQREIEEGFERISRAHEKKLMNPPGQT